MIVRGCVLIAATVLLCDTPTASAQRVSRPQRNVDYSGGYTREIIRRGAVGWNADWGVYRPFVSDYSYGTALTVGYGGPIYDPYFTPYYGTYPYYLYSGGVPLGPYVFPPVYQPAETLFGPQAMKRFMGLDPNFAIGPLQNNPPLAALPAAPRFVEPAEKPIIRPNAQALERALKYMQQGDANFAEQRHQDAMQRYRRGAEAAPAFGEIYYRQGITLVALGRYEAAAKAYRRAIQLDPGWLTKDFRLEHLYGDAIGARAGHLHELAAAVQRKPDDGELRLALAIMLRLDGQEAAATAELREAAKILGAGDAAVKELAPPRAKDDGPPGIDI